jgi:Tol biopolymer transport system component
LNLRALFAPAIRPPAAVTREKEERPTWSPDGQVIAYLRVVKGVSEIWVMNRDGTHQARLITDPNWLDHPRFESASRPPPA